MFTKLKKTGFALATITSLTLAGNFAIVSTAQASTPTLTQATTTSEPAVSLNILSHKTATANDLGIKVAGKNKHRGFKRHGRKHSKHGFYGNDFYYGCEYRTRKTWSNHYGGWVWKKVRICF